MVQLHDGSKRRIGLIGLVDGGDDAMSHIDGCNLSGGVGIAKVSTGMGAKSRLGRHTLGNLGKLRFPVFGDLRNGVFREVRRCHAGRPRDDCVG